MRQCEFCGGMVDDATNKCGGCGATQSTTPAPSYAQPAPVQAAPVHAVGPGGQAVSDKEWIIALLLNFFAGYLGVHRFYTGHIGIGLIQFLTGGMCGIWWLIDFILLLVGSYNDSQGRPLKR